jgi:hypothetical protein
MKKNIQETQNKPYQIVTSDEACFLGVSSYVGGLGGAIVGAAGSSIATGSASTAVVGASCLVGCVTLPAVAAAAIAAYKLFGMFSSANILDEQKNQKKETFELSNSNQIIMNKG